MSRLNSVASWFLTCVGINLLILAALAAPDKVFADAGCGNACFNSTCATLCSGANYQTDACQNCLYQCCQDNCTVATDQDSCCKTACSSWPDAQSQANCEANCMAGKAGCKGDPCEDKVNCFFQDPCDNLNTYCHAIAGCAGCLCKKSKIAGCQCQ